VGDEVGYTYSGLSKLRVRVEIVYTQECQLHADVDEVNSGGNLNVLGNDTEADHFVASADTLPGDKVTRQKGRHAQRIRGSTFLQCQPSP
jgi:hypothetical protein